MIPYKVALARYESPVTSVQKAIEKCDGLKNLPKNGKVYIKPNIVMWTATAPFPKWGVITTSRVIEDMVILLKDMGISDITIGEGIVSLNHKDRDTSAHAFRTLGYETLNKRYGVKSIDVFDRPFEKKQLSGDIELSFNTDILESDFVVNIPVLKTHAQTVVSLGIKNLKGMIDIPSRKKCHNPDPEKNLHYHVSKLHEAMPPMLTLIDGIYSLERGPAFDGRPIRSDILVASADILSADMVGAKILGHDPDNVPYIKYASETAGRKADLTDIIIAAEPDGLTLDSATRFHNNDFPYTEDGSLPVAMDKRGITGISYRKYDLTMCTYCSVLNAVVLTAVNFAWKNKPFDDIEVLTGKIMKPTKGKKKTILLGKCMYQANKNNPDINEMIAVKGCPPDPMKTLDALQKAGIDADPNLFCHVDQLPSFFMPRFAGRPEFEESFFQVS